MQVSILNSERPEEHGRREKLEMLVPSTTRSKCILPHTRYSLCRYYQVFHTHHLSSGKRFKLPQSGTDADRVEEKEAYIGLVEEQIE